MEIKPNNASWIHDLQPTTTNNLLIDAIGCRGGLGGFGWWALMLIMLLLCLLKHDRVVAVSIV